MATRVVATKTGLKLACDVSAVPVPRPRQVFPIPDIHGAGWTFLSLSSARDSNTGIRSLIATVDSQLPGGSTDTWTLRWSGLGNTGSQAAMAGRSYAIVPVQDSMVYTCRLVRQDAAGNVTLYPTASLKMPPYEVPEAVADLQGEIANLASDNILSPSEKPYVVMIYTNITNEKAGIDAQADASGASRVAYDASVSALTAYLGTLPGWDTIPGANVSIVGTTFRQKFADVSSSRQALLNAIAAAANTSISTLNSDDILSRAKKPQLIKDYNSELQTQSQIQAQANAAATSHATYDAAVAALTAFLGALAPSWTDTTQDTPLGTGGGAQLRSLWTSIASARQAIQGSIAGALAQNAQNAAIASVTNSLSPQISSAASAAALAQSLAQQAQAQGTAINRDPLCTAAGSWDLGGASLTTVTDGQTGNGVITNLAGNCPCPIEAGRFPIDPNRTYRVRCLLRTTQAGTGVAFLAALLFDANGNDIAGDGRWWYYAASAVTPPSTWTPYQGLFGAGTAKPIPANARMMTIGVILNYVNSGVGTSVHQAQGLWLEDVTDAIAAANQAASATAAAVAAQSGVNALNNTTIPGLQSSITTAQGAANTANAAASAAQGTANSANSAAATAQATASAAQSRTESFAGPGSLPALPSAIYPSGKMVFSLSDYSFYKVNTAATGWDRILFAATGLFGQLAANQIGAGQILAAHLAISAGGDNLLMNSSFSVADANYNTGAAFFNLYANDGNGSPSCQRIASGGFDGGAFLRVSWSANTGTRGIYSAGIGATSSAIAGHGGVNGGGAIQPPNPGWQPNTKYVLSFWARATGAALGQQMALYWNTGPVAQTWLSNPPLTANWQLYSVQLVWGASVDGGFYISVKSGSANGASTLDFDHLQVQFGDFPTAWLPSSQEVPPGSIVANMCAANLFQTTNFTQDPTTGAPTAGAAMSAGTTNPVMVGPGGMVVGIQGASGWRTVAIDSAAALALGALRGTATTVATPQRWYAGNNNQGGFPSTACLQIMPRSECLGNGMQYAEWDLVITPTATSDNLDGLRRVEMEFYVYGYASPYRTKSIVLSDRGYYNTSTQGDALNCIRQSVSLMDRTSAGEGSGYSYNGYIRARLVGVEGAGDWRWYAPAANGSLISGSISTPWSGSPSGGGGTGGSGGDLGCVPAWTPLMLETLPQARLRWAAWALGRVLRGRPVRRSGAWLCPVQWVREGDQSAAWDETTLERLPGGARVEAVLQLPDRELWELETEHGALVASHDHRIHLPGGDWPALRTALAGQETRWEEGGQLVPTRILSARPLGRRARVYHLGQSHGHVYVAGGAPGHNTLNYELNRK